MCYFYISACFGSRCVDEKQPATRTCPKTPTVHAHSCLPLWWLRAKSPCALTTRDFPYVMQVSDQSRRINWYFHSRICHSCTSFSPSTHALPCPPALTHLIVPLRASEPSCTPLPLPLHSTSFCTFLPCATAVPVSPPLLFAYSPTSQASRRRGSGIRAAGAIPVGAPLSPLDMQVCLSSQSFTLFLTSNPLRAC